MILSSCWNAERHSGWAGACAELAAKGHLRVALDGPALYPDAGAAKTALDAMKGGVDVLFAPAPTSARPDGAPVAGVVGLCAPRPEERVQALRAASRAAQMAAAAGTGMVVLRAGGLPDPSLAGEPFSERLRRDGATPGLRTDVAAFHAETAVHRHRFLDGLCRSLFELCERFPDHTFALETPWTVSGVPRPDELSLVRSELPGRRIAYWHDTAAAARLAALGAVAAEHWLTELGPLTAGVTLCDWSSAGERLPPGTGIVDWPALQAQLGASMLRVLALDARFPTVFFDEAVGQTLSLGVA